MYFIWNGAQNEVQYQLRYKLAIEVFEHCLVWPTKTKVFQNHSFLPWFITHWFWIIKIHFGFLWFTLINSFQFDLAGFYSSALLFFDTLTQSIYLTWFYTILCLRKKRSLKQKINIWNDSHLQIRLQHECSVSMSRRPSNSNKEFLPRLRIMTLMRMRLVWVIAKASKYWVCVIWSSEHLLKHGIHRTYQRIIYSLLALNFEGN